MAIKFTGNTTTGTAADASGDTWITRIGEYVTNNGNGFSFGSFNYVIYSVEGSVISTDSGIFSSSLSFNNTVFVRETGNVHGVLHGIKLFGDHQTVVNEGSSSGGTGIDINGSEARIENFGTVRGEYNGLRVSGADASIVNHGLVSGVDVGIRVTYLDMEASSNSLLNTGTVIADGNAIKFSTNQHASSTLLNTGLLVSSGVAIDGGTGKDTIINRGVIEGHVTLASGDDTFDAGTGVLNGELFGERGDDTLILQQSNPSGLLRFDGGRDSDTIDLSGFDFGVWVDFGYAGTTVWTQDDNDASGNNPGVWREVVHTVNVENAVGTVGLDLLRGDGADNVFGYVGSPHIAGVDRIIGGGGSDTADFSRFGSAVWVDLGFAGIEAWTQDDGSALIGSPGTWRTIADLDGIENLVGTIGVDFLQGTAGANVFGYVGDKDFQGIEVINGLGGTDTVDFSRFEAGVWVGLSYPGVEAWTQDDADAATGSSGTWREIADLSGIENLTGTRYRDELRGDSGANVIFGVAGNDVFTGFGGNDTFVFENDLSQQGRGAVLITDFSADDAEKIDLSGVSSISSFNDLVDNHLTSLLGVAVIDDGQGLQIILSGWTTANFGVGNPISADDFIF